MASERRGNTVKTHEEILAQVRGLTAGIRDGAAAAEEARTVPREVIDALLSAGITRILVPPRFGGYAAAFTKSHPSEEFGRRWRPPPPASSLAARGVCCR
jgi:alkylation response protein AidB-like acyl-CoA dehydrogenase